MKSNTKLKITPNNKTLVIVESPTKAKTIQRFLGSNYKCQASYGHVMDLPKNTMGIDTEHNFEPHYTVPLKAKTRVTELKKMLTEGSKVILATDADREGEMIAWNLVQVLNLDSDQIASPESGLTTKKGKKIKMDVQRIVFHEITKDAIQNALKHSVPINHNLVNAQQARRILDRLIGYELSPLLWKKIKYGLSAGRVQSVALFLIIERENEIRKFQSQEYWSIEAEFLAPHLKTNQAKEPAGSFSGYLYKVNNKVLDKMEITNEQRAQDILTHLENAAYTVSNITSKEVRRLPDAPFITSTLQQEANYRFNFSAKQTMVIAQQLYEGINIGDEGLTGLITYMRTDSTVLSDTILSETKDFIFTKYGTDYVLPNPRIFKTSSKNAQEAHEAIRPTKIDRDPETLQPFLDDAQYKLYSLIWRRTVASQAKEAIFDTTTVDITASKLKTSQPDEYIFRSTGSVIKFDGFLKIYTLNSSDDKDKFLPPLNKDDLLGLQSLTPSQHFTKPPARYNEATLIKILEKNSIGRPSTYASIISTLIDRTYIEKKDKQLVPTEIGELVNNFVTEHFPNIVNIKFTANMEDELDEIARGEKKWEPIVRYFYTPFKKDINTKLIELKKYTEESDKNCPNCGKKFLIKFGRFGKFLACSDYPVCKTSEPLPAEAEQYKDVNLSPCDQCGKEMIVKRSKFGAFIGCTGYPECKNIQKIQKGTGVKCPECGIGELVEKMNTKRKILFYSCNQYPNCKFILNKKPSGDKCSVCGSLLVIAKNSIIECSQDNTHAN